MVRNRQVGSGGGGGIGRAGTGLALLILGLLAAGPATAADAILERLAGEWIGRGTGLARADATPETLYCRLTNTLSEDGTSITQAGRCALGSNTARISGEISIGEDGNYSGSLKTPQVETADLTGRAARNRIDFTATFKDPDTGEDVTATVAMTVGDESYSMVVTRGDWRSTDLAFTRAP